MIRAMSNARGKQLLQLAFVVSISLFGAYTLLEGGRRDLAETRVLKQNLMRRYGQSEIESCFHNMETADPMMLVFDGQKFRTYDLGRQLSFRNVKIIPFMVHALKTSQPERFQPGQPVFEMIFSTADLIFTGCVNELDGCPIQRLFPPIISFSSVHRQQNVLPTAESFPNPTYMGCLYDFRMVNHTECKWPEADNNIQWDDLENQIVWRGSDYDFLHSILKYHGMYRSMEKNFTRDALARITKTDVVNKLFDHYDRLSPRWQAVALMLKTRVQNPTSHNWINAMFTGKAALDLHKRFSEIGMAVSEDEGMDSKVMSRYKYQIDLGGGKLTMRLSTAW